MGSVLFVDQGYHTPCWVWQAGKFREGYGCFGFGGKAFRAHRVLWAWENGYDPVRPLDHLCHDPETCAGGWTCPHRACVNPEHLKEVTQRDNVIRGTGPSAANAKKNLSINGNPLDKVDPRTGWRSSKADRAAAAARRLERDRDKINARRRELRKRTTYEPRQCQEPECTNIYQPVRSDSRYCTEQNCINRRQNVNRAKRKESE